MTETGVLDGPERPLADVGDARLELAGQFLRGDGLEIGALHLATVLPIGSHARYVDRMSVSDLRHHYPELAGLDLAPVDVIDDGERLQTIEPESVDFIVANHFLEHCEDPIRTIQTHLSKLRPGGTLFYAVPDKRYTFDYARERTPLPHVIADHENGPEGSRSEHYLSWVRAGLVPEFEPMTEQDIEDKAAELEAEGYSIHFHVWTQADLTELMFHIHERLGNFEVEAVRRRNIETIVILRKHGVPTADVPVAAPSANLSHETVDAPVGWPPAGSPPAGSPPARSRQRSGIPLAGLREALDKGSATAHWSIDPDGIDGRAWVIYAGDPVTVALTLDGPVRLQARARFLPHDWRDGTGKVRICVVAIDETGHRDEVWSHVLAGIADPSGVAVDCQIPAATRRLLIGAETQGARTDRTIARVALVEPYLSDPKTRPGTARSGPERPSPPVDGPTISVLCPVHDPPADMLAEAIDSVARQTYANWELILSDDGSRDPGIIAALQRRAETDPRIKLTRRPQAGGISVATNAALELATGDYIALLDHDDTLDPHALAYFADAVARDPSLDMLYSDEDIVLDGRPVWVHHKPAWSPDTLNTNGYTCHLGMYRRQLVREIGGFRTEYNGSQDVDMILRLTERTDRVGHVPVTLYHWRIHPDSTAGGDAKPYAYVAARNAIAGHLERCGIDAEVDYGPPGLYRVVHHVDRSATAAIVLAVDDDHGLLEAARSWMAQPHAAWTAVVAAPATQHGPITAALVAAGLEPSRFELVVADPAGGRAAALQLAATAADAARLLVMESPLLGLSPGWLRRLIGYADQPGLAVVGPVVLAADGRIAHAGVAVPEGLPLALLRGAHSSMDDHFGYGTSVYNVRALDGALMTLRATFDRLTGFDPDLGDLALIEYCMRAEAELGLRSASIGDVRLQAIGGDAAGNDLPRLRRFAERWHELGDPYYNANFRPDRGDFTPRH